VSVAPFDRERSDGPPCSGSGGALTVITIAISTAAGKEAAVQAVAADDVCAVLRVKKKTMKPTRPPTAPVRVATVENSSTIVVFTGHRHRCSFGRKTLAQGAGHDQLRPACSSEWSDGA
jgi:hypothetical protein